MMRFFKVGDVIQSVDDSQVDAFLKNNPDAIEISAPPSIARDKSGTIPTLSPEQKAQLVTDVPVPKPLTTEEYANLLLKPNKTKQEEASINEYINRTGGLTKTVKDIDTGKEYIIPKDEYNPKKQVEIGKIDIGGETSKILKQRDLERQKYIEDLNTGIDILKDYINQKANDISQKIDEEYAKSSNNVGQDVFSYGGAKGLVGIYDPINVQKYKKALDEYTKTLDILDDVKENLTKDKGFFTPLANKKPYLDLITGGFYSLLSSAPIMNIATKLKKGVKPDELSDSEKALIQSLLLKQQTAGLIDTSTGYKLGEILAGTIPFISAFAGTLPLRTLVSGGIKKAAGIAEKEAANIAEKEATNVVEKGIGDAVEKWVKDVAGSEATKLPVETLGQKAKRIAVSTLAEVPATAVQTAAQPTTYKDITENSIKFEEKGNGEIVPVSNIGEAAKQSFISNYGNNLFELAGEPVTGFFSNQFSKLPFKIGETYSKLLSKLPKLPKAGKEFNRALGISSIPGEVIEEELNKVYDATVSSDDPIKAFLDNQKELLLGTSMSTILLGAPTNIAYQTGNGISYLTYRKAKNDFLRSDLDEETKNKIIDIVDNAESKEDLDRIIDVIPDQISKDNAKKIVNYAVSTIQRKINYGNLKDNIENKVVKDGKVEVAQTKDGSAIFVKEKDGGTVKGIDAAGNEVEVKDDDISDSFFLPVEEFRSVLDNTIDEHEEKIAAEKNKKSNKAKDKKAKDKKANKAIVQQQGQNKVQGTQEQTQELPNEQLQAANELQSQPENAEANTENVVSEQVQQNVQSQQEQSQKEQQEGKSLIESIIGEDNTKEVADTGSGVESEETTIPNVDKLTKSSLVDTPKGQIFVISNEDGKLEYIDVNTGEIKRDTYEDFIDKHFGGQVESNKGNIETSQQENVTQQPVQQEQVQEQVNPVSNVNVENVQQNEGTTQNETAQNETVPTQEPNTQEGNVAETISPTEQTQDKVQEKPNEQINEVQPVINEQVTAENIQQPEVNEQQPIIQQQEAGQQTTEQPTENIQTTQQAGENIQTTQQPEEKTFEAKEKESFKLPNEPESNWQQVEAVNEGIYKPSKVVFFTHKDNTYEYLGEDKDNYFIRNSDNITYSIPKKEKALSKDIERVKKEKGISVPKNFFENTSKKVEKKDENKYEKKDENKDEQNVDTDTNLDKTKDIVHSARISGNAPDELKNNEFISKEDFYNFLEGFVMNKVGIRKFHVVEDPNDPNALDELIGLVDSQTAKKILEDFSNPDKVVNSAYIKNYDIIIFNGIPETKEDAFSLFVHEALVHRGMRVFFENEYEKNEFLGKIYDEIGIDGIKSAMDEYDRRHGYEVGSSFEAYKDLSKEALAEEYIAILSDKVKNKLVLSPVEQKWWDKVLEYIRQFIDKIRKALGDVQLTQEDVEIFTEYLINFGLHSLRGNIVNPKQKQDIIDRINEVAASLISIKKGRTVSGKVSALMNANDFFYKKLNYNEAGFLTPDGKVIVKPIFPRGAHNDLAAKLLEGVADKFPEIKEAIYTDGKVDKYKAFEYLTGKLGYIRLSEGVNEDKNGRTEFVIDVYSFATREQLNILKDMLKKYMNNNQFYVTISNNRASSIKTDKIKNEVEIPDKIENINKTTNYNSPLRDFLYSQRKRVKTVDEIFPENKKVETKVLRKFADYLLPLRIYLRSSGMSFQDANTVVNLLYKTGSAAYGRMKIFKETTYKDVTNSIIDLIKNYDKGMYGIDRNNWNREYEETLVKANRQLRDGTITQAKYDDIIKKAREELNRKMKKIRYKDIDLYMIAKHAIERNETMYKKELIDAINRIPGISNERKKAMIKSILDMPIDESKKSKINFSGMTTAEAEEIVKGFEKNVDKESIDRLWKSIDEFNNETQQLAVEYGYFKDEDKNVYGWKYYVPLQYFSIARDVNQSLLKSLYEKMEGRQSLPKSPLTTMMKKYSDLVYFGEMNLAKKKLADYIERYGFKDVLIGTIGKYNNEDVIVANGKVYRLVVDDNGKLVINNDTYIGDYDKIGANIEQGLSADSREDLLDKYINYFNGEAKLGYTKNYTQFFKDEKLHFMVFENPDINSAINASKVVFADNKITRAFAALTRTLATLYTTFSLPFQGRNAFKDFQTSKSYKFVNGKTVELTKRYKDLTKEEKNALLELFLKNGGQTGRANLLSLDDIQEDIVNDIYDIVELQTSSGIKHFDKLLKKYGKNFIDKIISISEKVERMQRFRVFAELYSNGATLDEAINAAKEITVNFDRRGELTTVISSYIAFFNPAVQAMYQQYQWLRSGDKKIIRNFFMTAIVYASFGVIDRFLEDYLRDIFSDGDDDEEDKKDRIFQRPSSYLRYNNFILPIKGYSVILPVSQAYAFFYGLGKIAYEKMNGYLTQDEAISEAASHLVSAYSPVNFDYGTTNENDFVDKLLIYSVGAITGAKPLVIASVNKQLITKQKNDIYYAKSALGKDRTSDIIKDFAEFMHNATGGDLPKSSLNKNLNPVIDIDPNLLEYFIVNYGGGAAQAGLALADGIYELTKKNDTLNTFDPTDLYIVRSFVKNTKDSYDYANFLQAVDYINRMRDRLKAADDTYNEKVIKDEYGLASTELPEYDDEIGKKLNMTKKKYEYFALINKIYQVYLNLNEKRNNLLDILQANNEGFLDDSVANKDMLIDAINKIDEFRKEIAKMLNYNFYLYERIDNISPEFMQESINDLEKRLSKVIK